MEQAFQKGSACFFHSERSEIKRRFFQQKAFQKEEKKQGSGGSDIM